MSAQTIRTVTIVGGGTAGWMTAAALVKALPPETRITLIESEEIGTIGVGEATVPSISLFNTMLGIDVPDFMRACEATFKLGIEFADWGGLGEQYMHPFTNFGPDVANPNFPRVWMHHARERLAAGEKLHLDDYNLGCLAARQGRFVLPQKGQAPRIGPLGYAFHIDATLYARYLRAYAEARGVTRIEGKVVTATQDSETGDIRSVTMESGAVIPGEVFVDCSGFTGLLIEKTLKAGYEDWSHYLPCNRAIAVPSQNVRPPAPYTRATADAAGWRWRIPLQHRTGNGYVYASDFISDDAAEQSLLAGLEGPPLAPPRRLQFVTGKRRKVWDRNCIAIGLSSGFLEPLESTSIYMIQTGIVRLLGLLMHTGLDPSQGDAFNRIVADEFEGIRDFIILHYKMTQRNDTPFWRHCRKMKVPDKVAENMEMFARSGRVSIPKDHPFPLQGWMAVMLGQGPLPEALEPLPANVPLSALPSHMREVKAALQQTVSAMPSQAEFLDVLLKARAVVE